MIAFATLLLKPATDAGMSVPDDSQVDNIDSFRESHPHFFVYCALQLGTPIRGNTSHWDNAKVIAAIPEDKIKMTTRAEFIDKGFVV